MSGLGKIAILGPGLLGGSIALAVKRDFPNVELTLWGRREESAEQGKALGISGATDDFDEAVAGAGLIILATPVGVMSRLVDRLDLHRDVLVTDVGSVKRMVHDALRDTFSGKKAQFIGSHPMAGSEKTGLLAASEDLLTGAACVITNDEQVSDTRVSQLEEFWQRLGMRTTRLTAEDHDYAVARVSHFPHVLASVGAKVGLSFEDIATLSGGGMRDTTRVAAGDPALWTEILMENSDALQRSLGECMAELVKFQEMLRVEDATEIKEYLEEAKRKRELI